MVGDSLRGMHKLTTFFVCPYLLEWSTTLLDLKCHVDNEYRSERK